MTTTTKHSERTVHGFRDLELFVDKAPMLVVRHHGLSVNVHLTSQEAEFLRDALNAYLVQVTP
jgi:hypothetical protein